MLSKAAMDDKEIFQLFISVKRKRQEFAPKKEEILEVLAPLGSVLYSSILMGC